MCQCISPEIGYDINQHYRLNNLGFHTQYKNLDGNEHKSTGTLEGVNLETWYHSKPYDYPIAPKRIVQTVLYGDNDNGLLSEMREALAEESLAYTLGLMFDDYAEKEIKIKL